jgi:hypothetical protein
LRYTTFDLSNQPNNDIYLGGFVGGGTYLADAAAFTVTAPNTITVDFTIAPGQTLAGEVRRSDSNAPVEELPLNLYLLDESGSGRGDFIKATETITAGAYAFEGLAPGEYLLHINPIRAVLGTPLPNSDLKPMWYGDAIRSEEAQIIEIPAVSASQTVSLDLTVEPGATITGVVTTRKAAHPSLALALTCVHPSVARKSRARRLRSEPMRRASIRCQGCTRGIMGYC